MGCVATTGRRDEATFFMAISFCSRVVSAVGLWFSGFIVSAAGISGRPSGGGTITAAQSRQRRRYGQLQWRVSTGRDKTAASCENL